MLFAYMSIHITFYILFLIYLSRAIESAERYVNNEPENLSSKPLIHKDRLMNRSRSYARYDIENSVPFSIYHMHEYPVSHHGANRDTMH